MKSDIDIAYHALLKKGEYDVSQEELREMRHELGIGAVDMNRAHWKFIMEAAIAGAKDLRELKKLMIAIVNKVA